MGVECHVRGIIALLGFYRPVSSDNGVIINSVRHGYC